MSSDKPQGPEDWPPEGRANENEKGPLKPPSGPTAEEQRAREAEAKRLQGVERGLPPLELDRSTHPAQYLIIKDRQIGPNSSVTLGPSGDIQIDSKSAVGSDPGKHLRIETDDRGRVRVSVIAPGVSAHIDRGEFMAPRDIFLKYGDPPVSFDPQQGERLFFGGVKQSLDVRAEVRPRAQVTISHLGQAYRVIDFKDEREVDIGRAVEGKGSVPQSGDSVSRRHARLFYDSEGLHVMDLGSTNGVWVKEPGKDWEKIEANRRHALRAGDQVLLGHPRRTGSIQVDVQQVDYGRIGADPIADRPAARAKVVEPASRPEAQDSDNKQKKGGLKAEEPVAGMKEGLKAPEQKKGERGARAFAGGDSAAVEHKPASLEQQVGETTAEERERLRKSYEDRAQQLEEEAKLSRRYADRLQSEAEYLRQLARDLDNPQKAKTALAWIYEKAGGKGRALAYGAGALALLSGGYLAYLQYRAASALPKHEPLEVPITGQPQGAGDKSK